MLFSILPKDEDTTNIGTIRKGYTKDSKLLYTTFVFVILIFVILKFIL